MYTEVRQKLYTKRLEIHLPTAGAFHSVNATEPQEATLVQGSNWDTQRRCKDWHN